MEQLAEHLAKNVADDGGALVFAGDKAGPLHRGNFNKRLRWVENVAAFAAMSGASLRDLMTRMGHDSMRAALIYQHKTQGADRKIADRLEALIQSHRDTAGDAGQPSS
jgi:hypothetical protein